MSRTTGKNRPRHDFYPTPMWLVCGWVSRTLDFLGTNLSHVIDLGAGDARIGRQILKEASRRGLSPTPNVTFFDIQPQGQLPGEDWVVGDYLSTNVISLVNNKLPSLFISNPPFSESDAFVMRTVDLLPNCAPGSVASFLLRLNWLGSKKRSKWLNDNPPTIIRTLVPRPSFVGKGTDATEYCLSWWFRDGKPSRISVPTFGVETRSNDGTRFSPVTIHTTQEEDRWGFDCEHPVPNAPPLIFENSESCKSCQYKQLCRSGIIHVEKCSSCGNTLMYESNLGWQPMPDNCDAYSRFWAGRICSGCAAQATLEDAIRSEREREEAEVWQETL